MQIWFINRVNLCVFNLNKINKFPTIKSSFFSNKIKCIQFQRFMLQYVHTIYMCFMYLMQYFNLQQPFVFTLSRQAVCFYIFVELMCFHICNTCPQNALNFLTTINRTTNQYWHRAIMCFNIKTTQIENMNKNKNLLANQTVENDITLYVFFVHPKNQHKYNLFYLRLFSR